MAPTRARNLPSPTPRTRQKQLHLWLSDREYDALRSLATASDESISVIVRRLIRHLARQSDLSSHGTTVPRFSRT